MKWGSVLHLKHRTTGGLNLNKGKQEIKSSCFKDYLIHTPSVFPVLLNVVQGRRVMSNLKGASDV